MNNLILRTKLFSKSIDGLFENHQAVLVNQADTSFFDGMNVLNFRDINLWENMASMGELSGEEMLEQLVFIYTIGKAFVEKISKTTDWSIIGRDFADGYTASNIKLLRKMKHPDFTEPVTIYVPTTYVPLGAYDKMMY